MVRYATAYLSGNQRVSHLVSKLRNIHAVVQAGGKGMRLRPLTESIPKPLVRVCGQPLIDAIIGRIAKADVRRFTVITGYLGEAVEKHVIHQPWVQTTLNLDFFHETEALGNIGALKHINIELPRILFCFGDLVTDLDFARLIDIHESSRAGITLASHFEHHQLQLGELITTGEGRVVEYNEKPKKAFLICSGIAVMETSTIHRLPLKTPAGLSDLITLAIQHNVHVQHWQHGAFWRDINSLEILAETERELRR